VIGVRSAALRREAGFSLIEVLVALTVAGLVAVGAMGMLEIGATMRDFGQRRADGADARISAGLTLAREIGQAYPYVAPSEDDSLQVAFDGGPESMTFVSAPPPWLGVVGLAALRLELSPRGGKSRRLDVLWSPLKPDAPLDLGAEPNRIPLIEKVDGATFGYYGPPANGMQPEWSNYWRRRETLPQLVRIRIRSTHAGASDWPTQIIHPMIDVAAARRP
jgi:general secretion pathway protein J